jgi:hypothetical protein
VERMSAAFALVNDHMACIVGDVRSQGGDLLE